MLSVLVIYKAISDLLLGVIDLQRSQLHLVYYDFYARIPANILKYFFSKPVNNKIIVLFFYFLYSFLTYFQLNVKMIVNELNCICFFIYNLFASNLYCLDRQTERQKETERNIQTDRDCQVNVKQLPLDGRLGHLLKAEERLDLSLNDINPV